MRLLGAALLATSILCPIFGQTYAISTFAGGGSPSLPVGILGTSANLGVFGIAVDLNGNVLLTSSNAVLRLDAKSGVLSLVAGTGVAGFAGDGGPATSAQLNSPSSIAVDSAGNVYLADSGNYCIRKISNGVISTVAGDGTPGFSGDGGPAISAKLGGPIYLSTGVSIITELGKISIAVDSAGSLYIADPANSNIRKVTNGIITTFVGELGPHAGVNYTTLSLPQGVAVDTAGNLYIADTYDNQILKVSNGTAYIMAGSGTLGYSGDNGAALSAELSRPFGVAVDAAGNLFIADTLNYRIRKVSGGVITTVAGNGVVGFAGDGGPATSAQLAGLTGVTVDSEGNLYIADAGDGRVRRVSNGVITTVAGGGVGDNGPAASAWLSYAEGVAADPTGNVYIADTVNNRVRKVSNGMISTVAGNGTLGYDGDNGPATSAELQQPGGVAVDSAGNLYIADTLNNRVRKVSNGVISTVAGDGTHGFSGDNGAAVSAELAFPFGVAVDSAGNLYIADTANNRVRKVSNGVITTFAGGASAVQLDEPEGVAVDPAGNVYIADTGNNRVRKVSNGVISTVAGSGTSGYSGDGGPASSAALADPTGVVVDAADNLYIADEGNNRVRKVANGVIATIAGSGATGKTGGGFDGDGGPATSALLSGPEGVAVDSAGNVYVCDTGNNRIRLLTPLPLPSIFSGGIVAVDGSSAVIQPGEWVSIFGTNLASGTATWTGNFTTSLGGTSVTIDGKAAYLSFVSPGQINLQAPDGPATGSVPVVVTTSGGSGSSNVTLAQFAPSFFLLDSKHVAGIILRSDGSGTYGGGSYDIIGPTGSSLGYATVAAKAGDTVALFGTGYGPTNPVVFAGQVFIGSAATTNPVTISINGAGIAPSFAGLSGAGLYQINLIVPAGLGAGDVPLQASVGGAQTPSGVVISLR